MASLTTCCLVFLVAIISLSVFTSLLIVPVFLWHPDQFRTRVQAALQHLEHEGGVDDHHWGYGVIKKLKGKSFLNIFMEKKKIFKNNFVQKKIFQKKILKKILLKKNLDRFVHPSPFVGNFFAKTSQKRKSHNCAMKCRLFQCNFVFKFIFFSWFRADAQGMGQKVCRLRSEHPVPDKYTTRSCDEQFAVGAVGLRQLPCPTVARYLDRYQQWTHR